MTGHRQEMISINLTVAEITDAIERAVLNKYKFLVGEEGWDCQDWHYHKENLNGNNEKAEGVTCFYVRDIAVAEDDAPAAVKKDCNNCECCKKDSTSVSSYGKMNI